MTRPGSPSSHPPAPDFAETEALRSARARLLREAERRRYRLHRLSGLTGDLKAATTELLRRELAAATRAPKGDEQRQAAPESPVPPDMPEPPVRCRWLPYRDD
ncbi:hypothetical protein GCM10011316_29160 [Roseibium aquae]|uniref:Uncharacterized protein n=1 Tax=Roseibium aquae TaxID=1323746 RepID=A0A916TLS5_9HYPH|nr:hypothetical protein [Roseibium aquae]GGB55260.1 hypothetical protein GCM10011316_29160 [Roseibium aquae]